MADFFELDTKQLLQTETYKPKLGADNVNIVRIMPPWKQGAMFFKQYNMHYGLSDLIDYGVEQDGWFAEPCIAHLGRCPICALSLEARRLAKSTENPLMLELAKKIRKKRAYVCNIVDMTANEDSQRVQLWTYGEKVSSSLSAIVGRRGNITHPVKGENLLVIKKEIPNQAWTDTQVLPDSQTDILEKFKTTFSGQLNNLDEFPECKDEDRINDMLANVSLTGQVVAPIDDGVNFVNTAEKVVMPSEAVDNTMQSADELLAELTADA